MHVDRYSELYPCICCGSDNWKRVRQNELPAIHAIFGTLASKIQSCFFKVLLSWHFHQQFSDHYDQSSVGDLNLDKFTILVVDFLRATPEIQRHLLRLGRRTYRSAIVDLGKNIAQKVFDAIDVDRNRVITKEQFTSRFQDFFATTQQFETLKSTVEVFRNLFNVKDKEGTGNAASRDMPNYFS